MQQEIISNDKSHLTYPIRLSWTIYSSLRARIFPINSQNQTQLLKPKTFSNYTRKTHTHIHTQTTAKITFKLFFY